MSDQNNKLSDFLMAVQASKATILDVVERVGELAAKSDEREKAHELKLVELNPDYAKERMQVGAALVQQSLRLQEKWLDQSHAETMAFGAGLARLLSEAHTQVTEVIKKLPLETLPLADILVTKRKTVIEYNIEELSSKLDRKLEEIARMTQSTKDKVSAVLETNGEKKPDGFGSRH